MKITFNVMDKNLLIFDSHLGGYEIDVSTVYFNEHHMFVKTWFTLFDFEERLEGCMGFIKATIEVLGPEDEPTITETITDDESLEKTVISPKIRPRGHIIISEVFRAEHIVSGNVTSRHLNPYVRIKYGGVFKETKHLENTSNPDFNQIVFLPAMLPNHSKNIFVELWDDGRLSDALIGTAIVPFNLFKDSNNMRPFWLNIYGPSPSSTIPFAKVMAISGHKIGTAFRGRILMRFSSRDEPNPVGNVLRMDFRLPEIAVPNPMTKTYTVRIDIFEGNELPTKNKGILHFCMGPHLIKSSLGQIKNNRIVWNESLEDRRITLPVDVDQIPDLLIYFCDEDVESHRISYIRLKARNFVVFNNSKYETLMKPKIIKFREEKSHKLLEEDQFPGFAVVRIVLFGNNPQSRSKVLKFIPEEHAEPFKLYLMLYVGRGLASGENDGTSNPYVEFLCGPDRVVSEVKEQTLNPNFNQILEIDITKIKLDNSPPPTLIVLVYHQKRVNNKVVGKSLLGRYWMMLNMEQEKVLVRRDKAGFDLQPEKTPIFFESPKWLPLIYDKEERVEGRLLMGYCISKNSLGLPSTISIPTSKHTFTLYPLGFRDVFSKFKKSWDRIDYDIKINNSRIVDEQNLPADVLQQWQDVSVKNCSRYINKNIKFSTELPKAKELCPVMEVFLTELNPKNNSRTLIGVAEYNLRNALKYYYGEEEDKTYKLKWEKNFYLDKLQAKEEGKKQFARPKVQKIKPENQLIYLDNFIFDVEFPSDKKGEIVHKQEGTAVIVQEDEEKNPQIIRSKLEKLVQQDSFANAEQPKAIKPSLVNVKGKNGKNVVESKSKGENAQEENKQKQSSVTFYKPEERFDYKYSGVSDFRDFETVQKASSVQQEPINLGSVRSQQVEQELSENFEKVGQKNSEEEEDEEQDSDNNLQEEPNKNENESPAPVKAINMEAIKSQRHFAALNMEDLNLLQKDGAVANDSKEISRLEIQSANEINELSAELSKDHIGYKELFVEENKDARAKQKESERKKLFERFAIRNPFKGIFSRRIKNRIEYQDYDTDDEEDFDDVLPYLKGRLEFQTDLEKHLFLDEISRTITSVKVYRGNNRDEGGFFTAPHKERFAIAKFKFVFYREDRTDLVPQSKIKKFLESISVMRNYTARIYVLRGLQLSSVHKNQTPKTFLKFIYNGVEEIDDGSVREGIYAEYYRSKQFENIAMPGTANLRIEIWEQQAVGFSSLLGYTQIDLEKRIFSTMWQVQEKKPVEKRNVMNDIYGSRGRLEMWIDIISAKSKEPMTVIYPKLQLPYELRVIVWETKDCVFKDEITKANDLYARGGVMRGDRFLETDTHWRCRNKGSFNWRWKFEVNLPVDENKNYGEDRFMIQLYDRDLIGGDDLIGEAEVDLHTHKMLKKAHYRKRPVDMRLREKGSGLETNMIWFEVFHPEVLDVNGNKIPQGKVLLSFQALPKDFADKFKNEIGRASPNFYPTLPDPVGRFSFDLMSPFSTLKAIIGPVLCYRLICMSCLIFWLVLIVMVGYYILTTFIGVRIALLI